MLRVVIDTNCLQTDELRHLLDADRRNYAVLPEHSAGEIFKPNSVDAIISAFSVLRDYPKQVLMLWGNPRCAYVDPRTGAIANCFIDRHATREFPRFTEILDRAAGGHLGLRQQLLQRRHWALERGDSVMNAFGDLTEALEEFRSNFDAKDLSLLTRGQPMSDQARTRIFALVHALAKDQLWHVHKKGLAPPPHCYNQFAWRYALCHVIRYTTLISTGARRRSPTKARNDHFDNVIATFGTYFNGIMSNDSGPQLTQNIARLILKSLGVPLAVDYLYSDHFDRLLEA